MSNFGVRGYATKKALREAVVAGTDPLVYDTSAFSNRGTVRLSTLVPSDVIVGPDPYNARNWYANVKRDAKGNLKVV